MATTDVLGVLRHVLPDQVHLKVAGRHGRDVEVVIGNTALRVRRLDRGWPRQVREALALPPRPDVLIAPAMSPGARAAATAAGVGWVDHSGAAQIIAGPVVIVRSGEPMHHRQLAARRWTPATLAVTEALLTGTRATVAAVAARTGLSDGAVTAALSFLTRQGLLVADAARGRGSARRVADAGHFLEAYAEAADAARRPEVELAVGVLWRDPLAEAQRLGAAWTTTGIRWALTGALAAAALAPWQSQIAPLEIYLDGRNLAELTVAARQAGLTPVTGGRLRLRPFPSAGTAALSQAIAGDLVCVPWPRVYADLRTAGVRGEDAAEHLREEMCRG